MSNDALNGLSGLISAAVGFVLVVLFWCQIGFWMSSVLTRLEDISALLRQLVKAGGGSTQEPKSKRSLVPFRKRKYALPTNTAMHCPACNNSLSASILSAPAPICPHCHAELSVE